MKLYSRQKTVEKKCSSGSKAQSLRNNIFLDLPTIRAPGHLDVVLWKILQHVVMDQYPVHFLEAAVYSRKNSPGTILSGTTLMGTSRAGDHVYMTQRT